jgi:hypothetical protein
LTSSQGHGHLPTFRLHKKYSYCRVLSPYKVFTCCSIFRRNSRTIKSSFNYHTASTTIKRFWQRQQFSVKVLYVSAVNMPSGEELFTRFTSRYSFIHSLYGKGKFSLYAHRHRSISYVVRVAGHVTLTPACLCMKFIAKRNLDERVSLIQTQLFCFTSKGTTKQNNTNHRFLTLVTDTNNI